MTIKIENISIGINIPDEIKNNIDATFEYIKKEISEHILEMIEPNQILEGMNEAIK